MKTLALALVFLAVAPAACQRQAPPTSDGAVSVIRAHYQAIKAKRFEEAYKDWEEEGKASGKTFVAFLNGYAQMDSVEVVTGTPGPIEGAADSPTITVPVEVTARMVGGAREFYTGTYTLRYGPFGGAKSKQRRWQITSAQLDRADRADSLS